MARPFSRHQVQAIRRTSTVAPNNSGQVSTCAARRDQLNARVAELQWELGRARLRDGGSGRVRVDLIVKHAAKLQDADAELAEVERILALEQSSTAGVCSNCGAPHSSGAGFCWQCGQQILRSVDAESILTSA